jgi:hypothetical protein
MFKVNGQQIEKDPNCDFSGLVAGTEGYLKAKFTFSEEWKDCVLVASFWRGINEHAALIKNNECEIPPEALKTTAFSVSVTGKRGGYKITTNRIFVRQEANR